MLNQEDIEKLKRRADDLELPPHTLVRSLLLLALKSGNTLTLSNSEVIDHD
jgi:hypothetical protein